MLARFSYARILHAIGQVLDQTNVRSIAIQEEEDGLCVEGFDSEGQLQVQARYDVPELYELITRVESQAEETVPQEADGVLHNFLARHNRELVGASF